MPWRASLRAGLAPGVCRDACLGVCLGVVLSLAAMMPDGAHAAEAIASARYTDETDRYPHAVLGDAIEYETLVVTLTDGREHRASFRATTVFEDLVPRLVDLDGDGAPEVITIESHERLGARLSVWGWKDAALTPIVATPFIGTRFRWLAPVGVGAVDLDGDGLMELAYVDRPHLAKTLRVWTYVPDGTTAELRQVASLGGLTNHRIGEAFISGGIRTCGPRPELVLANANWTDIMAVWMQDGALRSAALAPYKAATGFDAALRCREGS